MEGMITYIYLIILLGLIVWNWYWLQPKNVKVNIVFEKGATNRKDTRFVNLTSVITALIICIYFIVRVSFFIADEYMFLVGRGDLFERNVRLADRIFSFVLITAEVYFLLQGMVFLLNKRRAVNKYKLVSREKVTDSLKPDVALFIPVCNENPEMVRETIEHCVKINYENKRIYVIENSRDVDIKQQVISTIEKYKIVVLNIDNLGSKAAALNHVLPDVHAEYIVLLDADQRPDPNFLEEVIPIMDGDLDLAFIQTPELYTNFDASIIRNEQKITCNL